MWGENVATDETPRSWQFWETAPATVIDVTGDADWGKAEVWDGTPALGDVIDTGDTDTKTFTVTRDKYGTGSGSVTIYIRGDTSVFGQHDGSPSWAEYTAPTVQSWRYVQLRMVYG